MSTRKEWKGRGGERGRGRGEGEGEVEEGSEREGSGTSTLRLVSSAMYYSLGPSKHVNYLIR